MPIYTGNSTVNTKINEFSINLINDNARSTSNGALVCPSSTGAIVLDDGGHKRITWNDGSGNYNIRSGCYYSNTNGLVYTWGNTDATSGAASVTLSSDGTDGYISLYAAPASNTKETSVSWTNELRIAKDYAYVSNGFFRVGQTNYTASEAGAGALAIISGSNNVVVSTGLAWKSLTIIQDGSSSAYPFSKLGDISYLFPSGTYNLYTTVWDSFSTPFTTYVSFSNPLTPRYITSATVAVGVGTGDSSIGGNIVDTSGVQGGCSQGTDQNYTLYRAAGYCLKAGLRLCTRDEIKQGKAQGTGCSHDSRAIWTSTTNGSGSYYRVAGGWYSSSQVEDLVSPTTTTAAGYPIAEIGIRCCGPLSGSNSWSF